jgi:phospholipid/cholesterol/gamma-HCH transport system substrate-binding protein
LSELTGKAEPIIDDLRPAVRRVDRILTKIDDQVITPETAEDFREAVKRLRSTLTRADDLLEQAQQGKGPLALLLNDRKTAEDLAALINNLRRNGILFYQDDHKPQTTPAPVRRRDNR